MKYTAKQSKIKLCRSELVQPLRRVRIALACVY